jgi:hypothetical protein
MGCCRRQERNRRGEAVPEGGQREAEFARVSICVGVKVHLMGEAEQLGRNQEYGDQYH